MWTNILKKSSAIVVLLIIGGGFIFWKWSSLSPSNSGLSSDKAYWKDQIKQLGPQKAYEAFKKQNANTGPASHETAHIFGEVLYDQVGLSGITVCDADFAFGCYHSLIGKAIEKEGLGAIEKVNAICLQQFGPLGTGCQHGIGHAIVERLGHTKIIQAVSLCKVIQPFTFLGCSSGAFMEYNFPQGPRAFADTDPYTPCGEIDTIYQPSCYYELALWWTAVAPGEYKENGARCQALLDEKNKDACFRGLGNSIGVASQYNVEEAIAECKEMPTKNAIILCQAGVSWSLFAEPEHRAKAPLACATLKEEDKRDCLDKADLTKETIQ